MRSCEIFLEECFFLLRFLFMLLLLTAGGAGLVSCDGSSEGPPLLSLEIVSGDRQTGTAGRQLQEAVRVRLSQAGGAAVSGATVRFQVAAGGGSLSPATAVTDTAGLASTRWTLGTAPVWNRVTALAAEERVTFEAWAEPASPPVPELVFQTPAGFSSEGIAFRPGKGLFLGTDGGILFSPDPFSDPEPLVLSGEELPSPLGLAFGFSGNLYACDSRTPYGDVKQVSPSGVCSTLCSGYQEQPFSLPNSLAVDPDGNLYLAVTCDDRIFRIHPQSGKTELFASVIGPNGLAFDRDGSTLYVTTENPAIFCDGPWKAGGLVRVAVNPDRTAGEVEPLVQDFAVAGDGLTFDAEGNLYVVFSGITALEPGDLFTSGIYVYTPDGRFNPWISVAIPEDIFTNLAFGVAPFDPLSLYAYGFSGRVYRASLGIPGRPLP
jgi:sugar lactone lactonase YvrE